MSISKIACCTDFSENADAAFDVASTMAEKFGAELFVLHVLPPVINPLGVDGEFEHLDPAADSWVLKLEERMEQVYGSRIPEEVARQLVVLDGHVSTEILRFVEEKKIDLLILGAYGLSGMGLVVFGSVAKRVAHKAPCSVMIVRPPAEN